MEQMQHKSRKQFISSTTSTGTAARTSCARIISGLCLLVAVYLTAAAERGEPAQIYERSEASMDAPLVELDPVVVRGLQREGDESLSTQLHASSAAFGQDRSLMETPRSVSVLTGAAFREYGIETFDDTAAAAAGMVQRSNFGLTGTPVIRGDRAGVFFKGMERPFIGNKFPTPFGSFESMEIIRGIAPAHFAATAPGGVINLNPKSPYFDAPRSEVTLRLGTHGERFSQFDSGGPFRLGSRAAAWRVSVSGEYSDSWYDNVRNDNISIYGSLVTQLDRDTSVFTAAEYYRFHTNENVGWNRVTQDLIDHGVYIRGETVDLTDDLNYFGTAARGGPWGKPAPPTANPNGTVPSLFRIPPPRPGAQPTGDDGQPLYTAALVVPVDFLATLNDGQRALLRDVNGQLVYTAAYLNGPDGMPGTADDNPVATARIDSHTALSDPGDYADSAGALGYVEFRRSINSDTLLLNQFFIEGFSADKLSTYNYANATEQLVAENRLTMEQTLTDALPVPIDLIYGASVRYNYGSRLEDASPEPLNRRDLANPVITPNSVLLTGPQRARDGSVWWQFGDETKLWTAGAFASADFALGDRLQVIVSGRLESSHFKTTRPDYPYMQTPGATLADGSKTYWNASVSPYWKINDSVTLYGTIHQGASILFGESGTIQGEGNFADSELYEAGIKFQSGNGRLSGAMAAYYYDREKYSDRTGEVDPFYGKGLEAEVSWIATEDLQFTLNATWQRQHLRSSPGFRFFEMGDGYLIPLLAGAGYYTVGDDSLTLQNNPDREAPGLPEAIVNVLGRYNIGAGFGVSLGATWQSGFYLNHEHTLEVPDAFVVNAALSWESGRWTVFLRGANLTDADVFTSGNGFAGNAIVTKQPGPQAWLEISYRF